MRRLVSAASSTDDGDLVLGDVGKRDDWAVGRKGGDQLRSSKSARERTEEHTLVLLVERNARVESDESLEGVEDEVLQVGREET